MGASTYEYNITIHSIPKEELSKFNITSENQVPNLIHPFSSLIAHLNEELPNLSPGDWEIVSHDVIELSEEFMITFLVRRDIGNNIKR